jgi:C4-dicarboxylate-specific signal transduction histidine kinase
VLLNLIINALHAIEALSEKWIKINVTDDKHTVRIEVVDSGPGIPAAIQDKMFRTFFTTKAIGLGTGLGLSISRTIIEIHDGTLVINNDGPNTAFVISLPKLCA